MAKCAVCDTELQLEQKTCHVCGSAVETAPSIGPIVPSSNTAPPSPPPSHLTSPTSTSPSNERECPACGQVFGADYQDEYCPCGSELQPRTASTGTSTPVPITDPPTPSPPTSSPPSAPVGSTRPPVGTICLVVYSDTKPRLPIKYVPIAKDVLSIGREDALRGDFPDLDLGSFLDSALSKKVSRRHAEVLRARDSQTFTLRPLPGNTGTQIGKELATPGQDYPLTDGTPIVLGGVVWMKFETIK
jgi:FHA domain